MKALLAIFILIGLLSVGLFFGRLGVGQSLVTDPNTVRSTEYGRVVGRRTEGGGFTWQGIPYAAPPIGDLRWRPPQAPHSWTEIRDSSQPGSRCSQPDLGSVLLKAFGFNASIGSEDCLYLNVWAPVDFNAANHPVMVWIHGGGNVIGDGGSFDGRHLAESYNSVVVTMNYRLGVLGWFLHSAVDSGARGGNYALMDILMALKWVNQNISQFGGDPMRVTLFGESAGAANIYALMHSRDAEALMHSAIIQSGGTQVVSPSVAQNFKDDRAPGSSYSSSELLLQLLINDGRVDDRMDGKRFIGQMSPDEIADYLRGASYKNILKALNTIAQSDTLPSGAAIPQLIRDGGVLPAIGQRWIPLDIPVLIGSTRDEFSVLLLGAKQLTVRGFGGLTVSIPNKSEYYLAVEYLSLLMQADYVDKVASAFSATNSSSVFVYRFEWDELGEIAWLDDLDIGASHGLDVPFVFGTLDLGSEFFQLKAFEDRHYASFQSLSVEMMSRWSAFAATGEPNSSTSTAIAAEWQQWSRNKERLLFSSHPDRIARGGITRQDVFHKLSVDSRFLSHVERCNFLFKLHALGYPVGPTLKEIGAIEVGCDATP